MAKKYRKYVISHVIFEVLFAVASYVSALFAREADEPLHRMMIETAPMANTPQEKKTGVKSPSTLG